MHQLESEITVIGAGLAGVCAALAAARQGKTVVLAGDRPVLGGNSSSEIRMWTRGACGAGSLFGEEMGILGELKLKNLYENPDGNVLYWDEILLDAVLAEKNITLLLNTCITHVECESDQIRSVSGFQLGSEREYRICSEVFVDATGDGSIGCAAGVPFFTGEESRAQYGEEYAPETATSQTLGSSIFYYTKRLGHPVPFVPPGYIHSMQYVSELLKRGGRIADEKQNGSDYWWFEYGGIKNTIDDAQEINLELKRLALGVWNYIKNSGQFDADNLTLEWIGSIAGKRESRRMITDYVLTQTDIQQNRSFEDNGFYGGWYLDFHPAQGMYAREENCTQIPVATYPIPLRTLFSSKCPNLLFAGRIIGATHAAFSSTRIMNTCALSGQAAGTLAACCVSNRQPPAQQVSGNIGFIQQQLIRDDVFVIGEKNRDPADLAKNAICRASSSLTQLRQRQTGKLELHSGAFLSFPAAQGVCKIRLFPVCSEKTTLHVRLCRAALPSRLCQGELLAEQDYSISPGENLLLPFPPQKQDCLLTAYFSPNTSAALLAADCAPVGFLMGQERSMEHQYPLVEVPLGALYAPENVLNGISRPYCAPNLWISHGEENPRLELEWKSAVTCTELWLYLNPDFAKELPSSFAAQWSITHMLTRREGRRAPELAHTFTVQALLDGKWQDIVHVADNYQRLVKLIFPSPVTTSGIRIVFYLTPEQSGAQVFEIRVYEKG